MRASIREAAREDVPALVSLIAQLGFETTEPDVEPRVEALAEQGFPALVADDGPVIGCLTWNVMTVLHRDTPVGRISMLIVDADHRSKGVGGALVAEAEARMTALGCTLIEVTSNEKLVEAHLFYQRLGYARTSLRFAKRLERGWEKQ